MKNINSPIAVFFLTLAFILSIKYTLAQELVSYDRPIKYTPADINKDGAIDAKDLDMIIFDLKNGQYNKQRDLNEDGKVSLLDVEFWRINKFKIEN